MTDSARTCVQWLNDCGIEQAQLTEDSREVCPGDVFLAFPGSVNDGRTFIADAIDRGAAAVIWESDGFTWQPAWTVPNLSIQGLRQQAAQIAALWYRHPSERMRVVAVTGTNGKTSITQWIAQGVEYLNQPAAVIGTLGIGRPGQLIPSHLTTPDPVALQRAMAQFADSQVTLTAIEASSIGIVEGRLNEVTIDTAVLTNLTRDHLDYHGTMAAYRDAKTALFHWPGLRQAVINIDDAFGAELIDTLHSKGRSVAGYTLNPKQHADRDYPVFWADSVIDTPDGMRLTMGYENKSQTIDIALIGRFNVSNLLAMTAVLTLCGHDWTEVVNILPRLRPISGRLQRAGGTAESPLVLVDYAHTPDALENALSALRPVTRARGGKLYCIFGCGGNRDTGKRAQMGAIAAKLADCVMITTDNPRFEEPMQIIKDIVSGISDTKVHTNTEVDAETDSKMEPGVPVDIKAHTNAKIHVDADMNADYQVCADRREAIGEVIRGASIHDVVLIAGKGHETYQEICGVRYPFSDLCIARGILQGKPS